MKRNIGTRDRLMRALVGAAVLAAGLLAGSWWGLLGLVPLAAAIAGYCVPYALLGIDTARETPAARPMRSVDGMRAGRPRERRAL